MIFYRSTKGATSRSLPFVRTAAVLTIAAYPAGALTLALGPDGPATSTIGFGLILVALGSAALLATSSIQRIVAEESGKLDEFELQLRHRAMSTAFAIFTAIVLGLVAYGGIAADRGWWLPDNFDGFNGLFWGLFLTATTLPTACLAFQPDVAGDALA